MRICNTTNIETVSMTWKLPDIIIKIPGVKKIKYVGEGVQRKRTLLLNGVVRSNNDQIIIGPAEYFMNVYSIKVWRTKEGQKYGEPIEILVGTNYAIVSKAWNIIRNKKILFEHIETILQDEYNIPNSKDFDDLVSKEAGLAFRRIARYDTRIKREDTFRKENIVAIDWSYLDDIQII